MVRIERLLRRSSSTTWVDGCPAARELSFGVGAKPTEGIALDFVGALTRLSGRTDRAWVLWSVFW